MNKINELVEQLLGRNPEQGITAVQGLSKEVQTSTTSMTSIPKPLKFIHPHYAKIIEFYNKLQQNSELKTQLANLISVLSMTMAEEDSKDCIKYLL